MADTDDELEKKVKGVLDANKHMNFVQRLIDADKYPKMKNPNGSYSTHSMSSGEREGKGYVFPTVIQDKKTGELKRLEPNAAFHYAVENKEAIQFDNPQSNPATGTI